MKDYRFDWMMTDIKGNVLVERGFYTMQEQFEYEKKYTLKGYTVNTHISSIPNVCIMEPETSDDKRKEMLMEYVTTLSIREQALLLAWLSNRLKHINLTTIWKYEKLRKVYNDLQNIHYDIWSLKDSLIVALRKETI